jgi:hypothetical protein
MSTPAPDDGRLPRDRPLSPSEQQAFDRILDDLAHGGSTPTRSGWRHEYVTVRLPQLRTALLVAGLALVGAIVVGGTATWWMLVGLIAIIVGLPMLLLHATGQHKPR